VAKGSAFICVIYVTVGKLLS